MDTNNAPTKPEWDGEMPVLDFLINAVWYGVPAVIVFVLFLAALRLLGVW